MTSQIKKIAIVGRDLDAWITAFFLKTVLDKSRNTYEITLIDLGTTLTVHDIFAVLPSYKMLHKTLGANEEKLRKTAKATIFFGQRFSGWSTKRSDFFHAYDRHGINFNGIDFFQYWLKAVANGLKVPLEDFSLGVAAAKHRRFVTFTDENDFSHAAYGYHLSAKEYVDAIVRAALDAGVKREVGEVKEISMENETIKFLQLANGKTIEADFYIDASGSDAVLISALVSDNFQSWEHWFPCDRMVTTSVPPLHPIPAFSQIAAFSSGWCGLYPLQNRTAVQALYSSHNASFSDVVCELKSHLGIEFDEVAERNIKCGILKRPWVGNCLSLGSTAATLEPLEALQQHSLVVSMVMLRQLFPNGGEYENEREIYNDKMHSFLNNLRDFQLSHYALNSRDDPFWRGCRNAVLPEGLTKKIKLYKERGYISIREDETFQEENWVSIFNGHGLTPECYSPLVDNMNEEEMIKNFQSILRMIKERIHSSPLL
ncbi:tryptophan 7-halogenase [Cellvibrio fontiphilus]|jgi:tryptophan halogenase|uniref:Tryptophan 7-halogenase n=1 Tax=Cellvibrio fontiphilus TaxID=1815559 RepID=A0ABV7FE37_9GAMM